MEESAGGATELKDVDAFQGENAGDFALVEQEAKRKVLAYSRGLVHV